MLIQGDFNGSWLIMRVPDWEHPSEAEHKALLEAGWLLEEERNEDGELVWSEEAEKYLVDNYPWRNLLRAPTIKRLVAALGPIENAYCYPYRVYNCHECSGSGRALQGGMRGYVYTEDDFRDDPDFYEDMMGGRYDGTCQSCGGSGTFKDPAITGQKFEIYSDEWLKWVKDHKLTCQETVFDHDGKKHRPRDEELSEKVGYDAYLGRVNNAFMSHGTGATAEEAIENAKAEFARRVESGHFTEIHSTYRVEEQGGWHWDVGYWQYQRTLKAWREAGKLTKDEMYNWVHFSNRYYMVEHDTWTQELEDEWVAKTHERIIGKRFAAYGSNTYYRPKKTNHQRCSHQECIPSNEPQWAVKLHNEMEAQTIKHERQARADRETAWGEAGVPLHERY